MIPANQNRETVITSVTEFLEEESHYHRLSAAEFANALADDRFLVVGEPDTIDCTVCGGVGNYEDGSECTVCQGYGSVPIPMALVPFEHFQILEAINETRHGVEFKEDSWTLVHPLVERLDDTLFDCPVNLDYLDGPPALGRFWIEPNGTLTPMKKKRNDGQHVPR